ncbi:hypothetical protein L211DRAFT_842705 [Terfezia boudieri ATCC MYA-4762]|uniref:Uncharacterized protein n=1 Tax=Terfezia boudieri ATCC MYA-4762 TaxID=1051890 RepID=A0A3N4LF89_9PEZI|nr:hypothetical protein L211DRAFT_842705 [Terfezia boudieri ATCC MYA-4762]
MVPGGVIAHSGSNACSPHPKLSEAPVVWFINLPNCLRNSENWKSLKSPQGCKIAKKYLQVGRRSGWLVHLLLKTPFPFVYAEVGLRSRQIYSFICCDSSILITSIDPVESATMLDSPSAEFEELLGQLLIAELRSNNSRYHSGVVGTSVAVDSVNGWALAGNEGSCTHLDVAFTDPNRNDRLLPTDMLDTGNFDEYAAYGCNTGPSAWTFGADFIPNWGTLESGHRPSSAASWSSLNQEQSLSPNQLFTSESNSDVDSSPLQLFPDWYDCFQFPFRSLYSYYQGKKMKLWPKPFHTKKANNLPVSSQI